MKLNFINALSVSEAIDSYVDTKVWKIGGKRSSQRPASLVDYLTQKMIPFIDAYPLESREAARMAYQAKVKEIAERNVQFPEKTFDEVELLNRITLRFKACYPEFVHSRSTINKTHTEMWIRNQETIEAIWKLKTTSGGSPLIKIEKLKAHINTQKQCRAIHFLKILVEELQLGKDPNAAIRLHAWTGHNPLMGKARGAYVWSRLGFNVYDYSKSEREKYELSDIPKLLSMKQKLAGHLTDYMQVYKFLSALAAYENRVFDETKFIHDFDRIIAEAQQRLTRASYPWEIAEMTVEGYPLGKYLTTELEESSFRAILYPNLPNSPGMKQHTKRIHCLSP